MSVFAIIVTYYPDIFKLKQLCQNLIEQLDSVIIVDNTPDFRKDLGVLPNRCEIISLGYNAGIAHAQNTGILFARENKASVIIFFDQDSAPEQSLVSNLLHELTPAAPFVIGPTRIDERLQFEYASEKLNWIGYPTKIYKNLSTKPFKVDSMISSGTAVSAVTFDLVGLMDEDFFIDYVDTEWCIRCRKLGVEIFIHPKTILQHSIGLKTTNFGPFKIFTNSSERCYYCVRNSLLLFRKSHIPFVFALKSTLSTLIHQLFQLKSVNNKLLHARMWLLGLTHGILGVKGPKP